MATFSDTTPFAGPFSTIDNPRLEFLGSYPEATEDLSFFALDLRESEREAIEKFFDEGNNKFIFAEKYVTGLTPEMVVPSWITEIRDWVAPPVRLSGG